MPKRPSWVKDMHGVIVNQPTLLVSCGMHGVTVYCICDEHYALGLEICQLL